MIECIGCGDNFKRANMKQVGLSGDQFICCDCFISDEDQYGECRYCALSGHDVIHHNDDLNNASECDVHAGESSMSEEDEEGWDDNIERWNED